MLRNAQFWTHVHFSDALYSTRGLQRFGKAIASVFAYLRKICPGFSLLCVYSLKHPITPSPSGEL